MRVTFHGVRGSTPCPCEANRRYGGNTACVSLEAPGSDPIILDLGTGFRFFGETQPLDGSFRAHALVTHLHWDHVQGLPFCASLNRPGARLDVYGPSPEGVSLADAFEAFIRPPYFPVRVADLAGVVEFHTTRADDLVVGDAKVRARSIPHVGPTFGYRIDLGGTSVAYLSDHQQPLDGGFAVAPEVLELVEDVDLLIHDAQYTPEEFAQKPHWGHCTLDYALHVATEGRARRLVLFHHDPSHTDDVVDDLLAELRATAVGGPVEEILAASEGLTISFEGEPA